MITAYSGHAERSSYQVFRAVIFALLMRELKTRFGAYRLGYFWALLEPMLHVTILAIIFSVYKTTRADIDFTVFLITGIVPWLLFANIVNRSITSINANVGLFNYRQLKPFDTVVARILLEAAVSLLAFLVLIAAAGWLGFDISLQDPLRLIAVFSLLFLFAAGVGINVAVMATVFPETQKFIPYILRPFYFISGIFFSLDIIPVDQQYLLLWNPLLHVMELIRDAYFESYQTAGGDWFYLAACAVVSCMLGMLMHNHYKHRLVMQ